MPLDFTVDHIGIRRDHYTEGHFIDDYNNPNETFAVPVITILQPMSIKHATIGLSNGTATVKVTYEGGDADDLEYTINDWTSSTDISGGSFTISSLGPGVYTLKVRDENDTSIEVETTFEIVDQGTYGVKYHLQFDTVDGDDTYNIYIRQRGYSGSITEICGTGDQPALIEYPQSSDSKTEPIKGSRVILNLKATSEGQFDEFVDADDLEYQVRITDGSSMSWYGYLVTEGYNEPYTPVPYDVQLVAVDNLGLLKQKKFLSRSGEEYNDPHISVHDLLHRMIREIRLISIDPVWKVYLPLHVDGESIATNPTTTHVYVNCNAFYDENDDGTRTPWNQYDVITAILRPLMCRMFMDTSGYFWIQYIQRTTGSVTYHTFGFGGTWSTSTLDFNLTGLCDGDDIQTAQRDQHKNFEPAHSKITVDYSFTPNANLIPKRSFLDDAFGDSPIQATTQPTYWKRSVSSVPNTYTVGANSIGVGPETKTTKIDVEADATAFNSIGYIKSLPIELPIDSSDQGTTYFKIKFHWTVSSALTQFKFRVALLAAGCSCDSSGNWTKMTLDDVSNDDVDDISFEITVPAAPTTADDFYGSGEFEMHTSSIPWNDQQNPTTQVRIFRPQASGAAAAGVTLYVDEVTHEFLPDGAQITQSRQVSDTVDDVKENELIYPVKIGYIDQAVSRSYNVYQFRDRHKEPIPDWAQTGLTGTNELLDILVARLREEYKEYREYIEGTFYGRAEIYNRITETSTRYQIDSMSLDLKYNMPRLKLTEVPGTVPWPT